nr:ARID DNA-binding domain-containing protein [Tanacetum cinerariifolium]
MILNIIPAVCKENAGPFGDPDVCYKYGMAYASLSVASKLGKHLRRRQHFNFIQRELRREKEARIGSCIKQISKDCKEMLKKKMEEIMLYNSTISHPHSDNNSQNKYKRYKCFHCKQRRHILKTCPMNKKNKDKVIEINISEAAKEPKEFIKSTKLTVMLKYPECIQLQTKAYSKEQTKDIGTIFDKLDDQRKFLFTYGMGEVVIKNDGQGYLIPGVHYAPEVTLNILSIDLLEKQGFEILYEDDRYNENTGIEEDLIRIKGNIYLTKVQTFNEYVAFFNLIKQDEVVSQEWDTFRQKFDRVVKWFYNHYLDKSLPGLIPPIINGVQVHLFDLYKLVEGLGGYLSINFWQEFGTIGEILGLSKQDGEEIKKCHVKYLDVFTSYYKTARVPKQEYNYILDKPTRKVKKDIERICPMSHQWDFVEACAPLKSTADQRGKGKIEHFGVKLEDEEKNKRQPNSTNSSTLCKKPKSTKKFKWTINLKEVRKRKIQAATQVMILPSSLKSSKEQALKDYDLREETVGKLRSYTSSM